MSQTPKKHHIKTISVSHGKGVDWRILRNDPNDFVIKNNKKYEGLPIIVQVVLKEK